MAKKTIKKTKEAKPAVVKKEKKKPVYETEYNPRYATCIAGFILVAVAMLFSAIVYLNVSYHNGDYMAAAGLFDTLEWADKIIGVSLLVVAAYGFYKNVYSESLFFVIFAVLILVEAFIPAEAYNENVVRTLDLMTGALVLIPTLMFLYKQKFMLSFAVIVYAFGCFVTEMCDAPTDNTVWGVCAVIAAAILIYIAIAYLVRSETGRKMPLI